MFGLQTILPKVKPATNSASTFGSPMDQKTCSQKKSDQKKKIASPNRANSTAKMEIENLKATQTTKVSMQQLGSAIS